MILGLGSDLIDIRRIEKSLNRFGDRFINRIFTDIEKRKSENRAGRAASYAKRFAAKEACAKALGTGIRHGVYWMDMGVVNMPSGQPTMELKNGALAQLNKLLPSDTMSHIHLSITDEYPYAQAIVIISAIKPCG